MVTQPIKKDPDSVRFVRGMLYVLLFLPLVFWPGFYYFMASSKLFFSLAVTQVMLVGLLWLWLAYKGWRPKRSWIVVSVLVYTFVFCLASVFGVDVLNSVWGSPDRAVNGLSFLHLTLAFLGMVCVLRDKNDWRAFLRVSVIVAVVVSLIFFYTLLTRDSTQWYALWHGGSTLGNSSFYGTYLIFHVAFAGWLACVARSRRERRWLLVAMVFLAITLLSTEAQAAVLAFIGGVVLFAGLWLTLRPRRASRVTGVAVLTLLSLIGLFVVGSLFSSQSSVREFVVERSSETRFILWDMAWKGFKDRPLLGWGPENFRDVFQVYYNPCLGSADCGQEVWFDRAHNKFFDVLVETGFIGLLAYLLIVSAAAWGILSAFRQRRITNTEITIWLALLVTYLVQSIMIFDTASSYLGWFIMLGFIHTVSSPTKRSSTQTPAMSVHLMWAFVPLIAILFYSTTVLAAYSSTHTLAVLSSSQMDEHLDHYTKALTSSSYAIDLRRSMLSAQSATLALDLSSEQQQTFSPYILEEFTLVEAGLLESIERSPQFLRGYLDLVFLYQVWGDLYDSDKTVQAFVMAQRAVEQFPKNQAPYWAQVSLLLDQNRVDEALVVAQTAVDLYPSVSSSLLRAFITTLFTGDTQQIQYLAQEIVQRDPALAQTVDAYRNIDPETHEVDLLFRFYYDASF
jgi:O-antigen ligase